MSAIFDKDPEEQELRWRDKRRGILEDGTVHPNCIDKAKSYFDGLLKVWEGRLALQLYAQEVSKPEPVNMPKPDYEQIAKDCVARAKETAPYLLQELGSVPTSVRQEDA